MPQKSTLLVILPILFIQHEIEYSVNDHSVTQARSEHVY